MKIPQKSVRIMVMVAVALVACVAVQAEDTGWKDVAEFSLVFTDGNTEAISMGLKNDLTRSWDKSSVTFKLGGIRVESTTDRFLNSSGKVVNETDTTAEAYYFSGKYERDITDRFFWYAGAGWDRNEFAGIKNRYIGDVGVGNIWRDTDEMKFKTSYGLTFTDQEDVFPVEGIEDTWAGFRFGWDYLNKLSGNTTFTNVLTLDGNLDETDDWRADMDNGLAVAMSERVALKLGLRLFYDNMPSAQLLEIEDTDVFSLVELDELDTVFTASVVINFM